MWICFIYTIKERCKLWGYVLYIQLRKGVSCVDRFYMFYIDTIKLCKGVSCEDIFIYIQLRKGVSCMDMFYIYN